jgi:glutamate-ammonia-ligase adenylyltransferase
MAEADARATASAPAVGVGMGKLGARELNVSSDIDLIYVYDEDGETPERRTAAAGFPTRSIFPARCADLRLIGDTTEHGFVFRVDLALRPNGNSGPPAVSLGALEEYFQVQGREWERFAWLKSRVIAPREAMRFSGSAQASCAAWCCHSCFAATWTTTCSSPCARCTGRSATTRPSAARGRPERANDVKLSRGGIREIEFTVQLLQVVRGGQFPELRTRPTLDALQRWRAPG